MSAPRAIPEIVEMIRNLNYELGSDHGRQRIADPAIRSAMGRRLRELKDELIEAERRLREERADFGAAPVDEETL